MPIWIPKETIPHLIKAVQVTFDLQMKAFEKELEASENGEVVSDEDIDPNDLVIFNGFVLPVLKEFQEEGFDSGEMLQKGFRFMVYLIPWYLNTYVQEISKTDYGKLAKVFYQYSLDEMSIYLTYIEDEHLKENIKNINAKILACAKSIAPKA